jgi:dTDP-4-amino-4,6-dideoxygalactose transaminase
VNPFKVVKDFEDAVAEYTGAEYVVAVNSCTSALFLSLRWFKQRCGFQIVEVPKRTYVSVPMQVIHAGHGIKFVNKEWVGDYKLDPLPIWDSARCFERGMCDGQSSGYFICTSHHWNKPLGIQQGGCILHDNAEADEWFRRARFDGRAEGVAPKKDKGLILGWHLYMSPEIAAEGLVRLSHLGEGSTLPNDDYPDLSKFECFK